MNVLFYDNVDTGHHPGYIAGIVAAAEQRNLDYAIASVRRPRTLASGRWIKAQPAPLRSVLANRQELAKAIREARAMGFSTLVDLYLDKQIWAVGSRRNIEASVHVLHHGGQYSITDRTGLANVRTRYLRSRLERLVRSRAVVVVHTNRTAEILAGVVPPERLIKVGYPIHPIPHNRRPPPSSQPSVLFVGAARREKGLDLLLAALSQNPDLARLRVVGRQPPGLKDELSRAFPKIAVTWIDSYVDDEALRQEYQRADLAVLPYRSTFGLHGGPSSVLLETLGAGLPIVTTTALADQLPPGNPGAIVATADSVADLANSLTRAVESLRSLSDAAAALGPGFVARNHTFAAYVDRLLEAAFHARGA